MFQCAGFVYARVASSEDTAGHVMLSKAMLATAMKDESMLYTSLAQKYV